MGQGGDGALYGDWGNDSLDGGPGRDAMTDFGRNDIIVLGGYADNPQGLSMAHRA